MALDFLLVRDGLQLLDLGLVPLVVDLPLVVLDHVLQGEDLLAFVLEGELQLLVLSDVLLEDVVKGCVLGWTDLHFLAGFGELRDLVLETEDSHLVLVDGVVELLDNLFVFGLHFEDLSAVGGLLGGLGQFLDHLGLLKELYLEGLDGEFELSDLCLQLADAHRRLQVSELDYLELLLVSLIVL